MRETEGKGDRFMERQELNMPEIKNSFFGFEIEMLFEYPDDEGGQLTHWYHGVVTKIINQKKTIVSIE
jgi:hypothetical protein